MTINELIINIKEENLSKAQLGHYYDELCMLYYQLQDRYAELEKAEAFYIVNNKKDGASDISIQREWRVSEIGQEEIQLKRNLKGVEKLLSSLKRRSMEFL